MSVEVEHVSYLGVYWSLELKIKLLESRNLSKYYEYIRILYNRGHKTYSAKGQIVNIFVFVGYIA